MLQLAPKPDLIVQVHNSIKQAIVSGELAPYAPLTQESLAASLGVSRQPVSHALVLLQKEGLIVDKGRKGRMVAPIDADKLLALYQVRGALDGLAARLCAERITAAGKARLQIIIEQGLAAVADNEMQALVDADVAFHRALYELSKNPEISLIAESSWPHMVRSMCTVLAQEDAPAQVWQDHEHIVQAIVDSDVQEAERRANHHACSSGQATYDRLKKVEQRVNSN